MWYKCVRWFLFLLDPERAHRLTIHLLNLVYNSFLSACFSKKFSGSPVQALGLEFPNPVGIAAGFDKDGECIDALFRLGFGFVEVGTVTPIGQVGNPRPRLFRLPQHEALINHMGFNNQGVDQLVQRLKGRSVEGLLAVNIGKNKDTPLDKAHEDYLLGLRKVYEYSDMIVINISSPNTPGLRDLQYENYFDKLLAVIHVEREKLAKITGRHVPVLVKVSLDFEESTLSSIVNVSLKHEIEGIISSNTSVDHSAVMDSPHAGIKGGLSGRPIFEKGLETMKLLKSLAGDQLTLIGVGGIMSGEDAKRLVEAGASLVQVYTGLVYQGPQLIDEIAAASSTP